MRQTRKRAGPSHSLLKLRIALSGPPVSPQSSFTLSLPMEQTGTSFALLLFTFLPILLHVSLDHQPVCEAKTLSPPSHPTSLSDQLNL